MGAGSDGAGPGRPLPLVPSDPCVTLVFRLEVKQGVAFRNVQPTAVLSLSFIAKTTRLGGVQSWERNPKNSPMEEREREGAHGTMELQFVGASVRWFPLLQPGAVYRLIALHTQDVNVLSDSSVSVRGGVRLLSSPSLLVQPRWHIHTLTRPLRSVSSAQVDPADRQRVMTVSEVLSCSSSPDVVSFRGVVSQRISLQEEKGKTPNIQSLTRDRGVCEDLRLRVTVQDCQAPGQSLQVYLDLSHNPYTPGLIAGATVLLHAFQRKVSRLSNVYCKSLPISCVTVTALGSTDLGSTDLGSVRPRPPPPMVLLVEWVLARVKQCIVGRIRGHIVCVLHLRLQWVCSLCGSIFTQGSCTRSCPPCDSTSTVFQAEAKVAVEDGSGEAQVWFSAETVARLLLLGTAEWEGLQRRVRVRGHLRVYARGRSVVCDGEDPLLQYLCCLCSSSFVCRQITLTCQLRSNTHEKPQLKKFSRGEREFITKFPKPLQLHCTDLTEDTHSL